MGGEIDCNGRKCAHKQIERLHDPENRACEHQIAHRSPANGRDIGKEDEADNVELAARGGQCTCGGKNEHSRVVQELYDRHVSTSLRLIVRFKFPPALPQA